MKAMRSGAADDTKEARGSDRRSPLTHRSSHPQGRGAKSLARRVGLAAALSAAIGGATASLAAGTAATGLLDVHDDNTLRAAATKLAEEVEEEVSEAIEEREEAREANREGAFASEAGFSASIYRTALIDELSEVDLPGARARIDRPEGFVTGDARLPIPGVERCEAGTLAGHPIRSCTVPIGQWTLTLTSSAQGAEVRESLLGWSVLLGIFMGAVLGGLASYGASVWALRPLRELSERVRRVRPADPQSDVLEPRLEHVELEGLRTAVVELVEQLGEALSSARGFAAEAAHELRTPLATIAGELELLEESASAEDAAAVAELRSRVAALVGLVQRLLILAQPDSVALAGVGAVDLADVFETVRQSLRPNLRERLESDVEEDALVRGDPALLGALLLNAIDNALKFSSDAVRVQIQRSGAECVLRVIDSGPGIAEEERKRVFEPFYRSRGARRSGAPGHGVGLALIAHVARVHGGSASLESTTGEGTKLEVRLPGWVPSTELTR